MSLKSLINKSVIKSDLRRWWWLGVLFAGMLFLTTALPARITSMSGYAQTNPDTGFIGGWFASTVMLSLFAVVLFSIVIPALMFSYLHHKSAVSAAHSLPITRGGLYISHLISAAILISGAVIINAAVMMTMVDVSKAYILIWMGLTLVYAFAVASFAAAASMLVGNTAAGIVLPGIVLFLPLFAAGMLYILSMNYLRGYTGTAVVDFLQWIYLDYEKMLHGGIFAYLALGIIFLALGYVFYKRRHLENHSRILAFDALNPVFMYGLALCAGLAGYAYIYFVTSMGDNPIKTLWIGLPFGIAGVVIARMIIMKTFKPRGVIKPVIIYLAMTCVVYAFFGLDITGFEKRVPDADKIENVSVISYDPDSRLIVSPGSRAAEAVFRAKSADPDPRIYDESGIETVLAFHKAVALSDEQSDKDGARFVIPITYTLSNGKTMQRSYTISRSDEELFELYCSVQELEGVKNDRFYPVISAFGAENTGAGVFCLGMKKGEITGDRLIRLTDALKKDVTAAKFTDYEISDDAVTTVMLNYKIPSETEDGTPITDKNKWGTSSTYFTIHRSYTNTIALLREWGMYDILPSPDDLSYIEAHDVKYFADGGYDFTSYRKTASDRDEMAKVLDYIKQFAQSGESSGCDNITNINVFYKTGENGSITVPRVPEDILPVSEDGAVPITDIIN